MTDTPQGTPAVTLESADELDRRRWRALHEWAAARTADRDDWDETALLGVMQSCRQAGVAYVEIEPVLLRLARTGDDHQGYAELGQLIKASARRSASPAARPDSALAALKAGNYQAAYEATHEPAVPGQGAAPATETNGGNE